MKPLSTPQTPEGLFSPGSQAPIQCSRTGCTNTPVSKLLWRNPKIHTEDTTKTWLACDDHEKFLNMFLRARSFPVKQEPFHIEESSCDENPH